MKASKKLHRVTTQDIFAAFIMIILALACVIPFFSMFVSATHENAVLNARVPFLPSRFLLDNYQRLSSGVNIWRGLLNSAFVAVTYTVLTTYVTGITAYGFAIYNFRFKGLLFGIILCTMMVPGGLGIIGQFQLMTDLHLIDSLWALILPGMSSAGAVFFVMQYTKGYFPRELLESGRLDGCSELYMYHRIALPIIAPALATQAIFMFIGSWNSFQGPLILIFSQEKFTMPVLVQQMQGRFRDLGVQYVGVSISVLPILAVFAFCSRWIVDGISLGSVKG